jgi:hypothetical protein
MKGKGERGNSDRGFWGKRKGAGGFLAKWPSSSSVLCPGQRQERGSGGGGRPASRPRMRTARGGKGGGRRGGSFPSLTLGRGGARGRLHGRRRTGGDGASGGGALVLRQGEGGGRGEVRRPGKRLAPFIGGERRFGRRARGASRGVNGGGGKISPLTISGGAVDDDRGGAACCVIGHVVQGSGRRKGDTVACPASSPLMAVAGPFGRARQGGGEGGAGVRPRCGAGGNCGTRVGERERERERERGQWLGFEW